MAPGSATSAPTTKAPTLKGATKAPTLSNDDKIRLKAVRSISVVWPFMSFMPMIGNSTTNREQVRTHWHRVILDESHYNNSGYRTKMVLAELQATHRHCVSGTPVGHSLDDLQASSDELCSSSNLLFQPSPQR